MTGTNPGIGPDSARRKLKQNQRANLMNFSAPANGNYFLLKKRGLGDSEDGRNEPDFDFGNLGLDDNAGDLFQDGLFNDLDIIMEDSKDLLSDFSSRQGLGLMSEGTDLNLPKKKEETYNCLLADLETQKTVDFEYLSMYIIILGPLLTGIRIHTPDYICTIS